MYNNINNNFIPSTGFIILVSTLLFSSGIVYWSFEPNKIEVFAQLVDEANSLYLKKDYKQAANIYSQAAHLHYEPSMKAKIFLAAANSEKATGNLNSAKNNLYLCFVNYPSYKDSYGLLFTLTARIKSDIEVGNFINKIHTIDNFPLVELIKAANLRVELIKTNKKKKQFKKLLNPQIQNNLELGPKPVLKNSK